MTSNSKPSHPISGWRASPDESGAAASESPAPEPDVRVIDTLNIAEVSLDPTPEVWDHGFVRTGHTNHNCGVCGIHNGYHGNAGDPRPFPTYRAAGAPSPTPSPQSSGMSWTDPWPGYRMVNLALVRECMDCGSLYVDELLHDKWHDMHG